MFINPGMTFQPQAMPQPPMQPLAIQQPPMQPARPPVQQPQPPQPTAWNAMQPLPAKVRGVAADQPPRKFVLPSPEALGVATNVSPAPSAQTRIDWNHVQARMERLGVLRYQKELVPSCGCRVTLLLRSADPTCGQPVVAQAESEAAAVLMALEHAETWARQR